MSSTINEGKYNNDNIEVEGKNATSTSEDTSNGRSRTGITINAHNIEAIHHHGCSDGEEEGGKKSASEQVVVSPSGHVNMTFDRHMLYKAVSYIYSKLVTPAEEGGLKDWIKDHCIHFSTPYKEEHFILATEIHKQYESLIEEHLCQFCQEENVNLKVFYATLVQAKTVSGMGKTIDMLLASASYKKFYKLMHRKWKEYYGTIDNSNNNNANECGITTSSSSRRGSLSPHHVKIVDNGCNNGQGNSIYTKK
jgi:hypothetical protein